MPTLVGMRPVDQGRRLPTQWLFALPPVRPRHVLVDQDHVAVGIGQLQVAGPLAIGVSADCQFDALGIQFRLQFTHILEVGQLFSAADAG